MVKQERAARTRDALIRSAAEVFGREGYARASLGAISAGAGVSTGALHFHFTSKADLAEAVEAVALGRLVAITAAVGDGPQNSVQSLVDVSHVLVRGLGEDTVLRAGFVLNGLRRHWQQWIEETLRQAQGRGELDAAVDLRGAATAVMAASTGFEVLGRRDPAWLSRRTMTRFWELLLPRLAAQPIRAALLPQGRPCGDG